MGAYAEALPIFGEHGVQVYPTLPDRPTVAMVKPIAKFRAQTVDPRFADANAAILAGAASGITVVDIDEPGSYHRDMAEEIFGPTPYVVETPSGGHHLGYRHSGERRSIRPFGKDVPFDLLGDGSVVVAPSQRAASEKKCAGEYRLLGDLSEALGNLPPIREGALEPKFYKPQEYPGGAAVGTRNESLFAIGRDIAARLSSGDEARLLETLLAENGCFAEPMPVAEVQKICANVWQYKTEGRMLATGGQTGFIDLQDIAVLSANPSASVLLVYLRAHHSPDHTFAVSPHGIAESGALQMAPKTIRRARDFLIENHFIEEVSASKWTSGIQQPAQFGFSQRGGQKVPIIELTPSPCRKR